MLNPSTNHLPQNALNHCTRKLLGGFRLVKLRNGALKEVRAFKAAGDDDMFLWTPNRTMQWHLDGTSVTSNELDIMEVM